LARSSVSVPMIQDLTTQSIQDQRVKEDVIMEGELPKDQQELIVTPVEVAGVDVKDDGDVSPDVVDNDRSGGRSGKPRRLQRIPHQRTRWRPCTPWRRTPKPHWCAGQRRRAPWWWLWPPPQPGARVRQGVITALGGGSRRVGLLLARHRASSSAWMVVREVLAAVAVWASSSTGLGVGGEEPGMAALHGVDRRASAAQRGPARERASEK
jgi:hypothetical protein